MGRSEEREGRVGGWEVGGGRWEMGGSPIKSIRSRHVILAYKTLYSPYTPLYNPMKEQAQELHPGVRCMLPTDLKELLEEI